MFQYEVLKSGGKMHSMVSVSDITLAVLLCGIGKCCCYFKYLGQLSLGF